MSTHCIVLAADKEEIVLSYYIHSDGYARYGGHGEFIYNVLHDFYITDGNFSARNHPNIQSLLFTYMQTCSEREEPIEYRSNAGTLVKYTADGNITEETIKELYNYYKEEYIYIIYRVNNDPCLTIAIYTDYKDRIIYHDLISNMDKFFGYTKDYLSERTERRVYYLRKRLCDPITHSFDAVLENILDSAPRGRMSRVVATTS